MADLNTLHTVARVVLALMALIAAILWFISARIEVPRQHRHHRAPAATHRVLEWMGFGIFLYRCPIRGAGCLSDDDRNH